MVVKEEGPAGLYRGLSASLTRQATYGTARIGLYQAFSDKVKEWRGIEGNLPLIWKFATSFSSGAIASAIGNPFDVSLVRMQADAMAPTNERRNYKGVGNAVTRIVREEGFSALYHGYRPTLFLKNSSLSPPSLSLLVFKRLFLMSIFDDAPIRKNGPTLLQLYSAIALKIRLAVSVL